MGHAGAIRLGRVVAGLALGVLLAFGVAGLGAAAAHAGTTPGAANSLASITPANGAALATAPTQIVLAFNQELGRGDFATVDLICGSNIDTGLGRKDDENLFVTFEVLGEVPRGICIIEWVLSDQIGATIVRDRTTFRVDADSGAAAPAASTTVTTAPSDLIGVPATTVAPAADPAAEGSSGGALWFGRFLSTLGILVVFGALALISVGWPEGPEYIVTVRFMRTMWVAALAGTVLYLVAFTADVTGRSLGAAVSPMTWLDLNDAGWAGRGALLRLVAVAVSGAVALRPERIIDPTSAMWAWAVPGVAVISVAFSRVDGTLAPIGFLLGALHALGAAVWIGGVALVGRVVLAGPGDDDLVQATRTFSRISVPAIALTCATGIAQMVRLDGGELFSSGHGRAVVLKAITVAVMIAVALAARQQVGYRLARAHELTAPAADRFRRAFGAEATVGVVVLAFSGWLLALTPPTADPLAGERYTVVMNYEDAATGFAGSVSIGPSRVGLNGFKVTVTSPVEGLANVKLRFKPPVGAPDDARFWIDQTVPELTGAGTAWLPAAKGIPLPVAGTWTLEVSATTPTGPALQAFNFNVTAADGSAAPDQPSQPTAAPEVSFEVVDPGAPDASFVTTTTLPSLFGTTPTSPP
ncbi:MAG TPA: CopD family protein [Ilumatobacter sp.]|nr:CopD family protein [Ilumatobacter sp.]